MPRSSLPPPPTASAPAVPMPAPRPPSAAAAQPPMSVAQPGFAASANVRAPRPPPAEAHAAATRAAPVAAAPRPPPGAAPTPPAAVRALLQAQAVSQRPPPLLEPMAQLREALAETSLVRLLPELFPPTAINTVSHGTFRDVLAGALYPPPVVAPPAFEDTQRRLFEAIAASDARQGSQVEWLTRTNTLSGLSVLCMGESEVVNLLFAEFDANNSGFLDRAEFETYVRIVLIMSLTLDGTGHPLHDTRALETGVQLSRAIFDLIDTDRTDAISHSEFSQWFGAVVAHWAYDESRTLSEAIQASVASASASASQLPLPPLPPGMEAPPVEGLDNSVERRASERGRQPVRHKGRVARGEQKHRGSVFHGMVKDVTALHKDHTSGLIHPQPTYFEKKASSGLRRWQKRWFKLSNNYLVYRSVYGSLAAAFGGASRRRLLALNKKRAYLVVVCSPSSPPVPRYISRPHPCSTDEHAAPETTRSIDLRQITNIVGDASVAGKYEFQLLHTAEGGALKRVRVRVPSLMAMDLWVEAMRQRQRHEYRDRRGLDAMSDEEDVDAAEPIAEGKLASPRLQGEARRRADRQDRELLEAKTRAEHAERTATRSQQTLGHAKAAAGVLASRLEAMTRERDALKTERVSLDQRLHEALAGPSLAVDDATFERAVGAQVRDFIYRYTLCESC